MYHFLPDVEHCAVASIAVLPLFRTAEVHNTWDLVSLSLGLFWFDRQVKCLLKKINLCTFGRFSMVIFQTRSTIFTIKSQDVSEKAK